jgi:molybdopterin-biosynthesis enzyme MoeA-like protein
MQAEILTIGTELLLGEIVDTIRPVARALRDGGQQPPTTVGDNQNTRPPSARHYSGPTS